MFLQFNWVFLHMSHGVSCLNVIKVVYSWSKFSVMNHFYTNEHDCHITGICNLTTS